MLKKLQEILGSNFEVKEVTTKKNNYEAHQISIQKKGDSTAALIRYEAFKDDPEGLAKAYFDAMAKNNDIHTYVEKFLDSGWIKEHIYIRLTSDANYAEEYIHRKAADLYMIPYVRFDEELTANMKLTHIEAVNLTENEVFLAAMKNMDEECTLNSVDDIVSCTLLDKSISDLPNYLEEEKEYEMTMLAVTNPLKLLGAASIFL